MAKFKGTLSMGYPTATRKFEFEIDDEELEGLSDDKREELINKYAWDVISENGYIEYNVEEVK